jgi:alpha-beta hydrolase superfamily lysophospholipase
MKRLVLLCILSLGLVISCQKESKKTKHKEKKKSTEVQFTTKDSLSVYGDFYIIDKTAPTILLFHQARANARGEYKTIIPELQKEGFNVLAVDQRTGGQLFGSYNRTIAKSGNTRFGYCDAYPDLEAALQYVIDQGFSGKKIVWGSSYSAALVIKLGAENPSKVAGVLAFSPASGKPMEGCGPNTLFDKIKSPLMVLRPDKEMEYESVKSQFALAKENQHTTYISENGVHGSSMLVENRTKYDTSKTWKAVHEFLAQFK